jgi:hypothetical protein
VIGKVLIVASVDFQIIGHQPQTPLSVEQLEPEDVTELPDTIQECPFRWQQRRASGNFLDSLEFRADVARSC